MSDEFDALGAPATARFVADALNRPGDRPAGSDTRAIADTAQRCANCDAALHGEFCAACGQKAHLHRSLLHVGEEILHGITHFDGKTWKTLPMLVFKPGVLTRDYIQGKRARYVAPVPLFLLIVFLMFFVFSFVHVTDNISTGDATTEAGKPMTKAEAIRELPKVEAELARIEAGIKAATANPEPGQLAALRGARIGVATARDQIRARANGEVATPLDLPDRLALELKQSDARVDLGNAALSAKARAALKNPELVFYKIQGKAYKFSFLLVPLSLPWLWLLFAGRREVKMYDHAIFALYSISFMSLLFIIASGAVSLGITSQWLWLPLLLAPVLHMYAQLKGAYALTRSAALWRTAVLALASWLTLSLYVVLMILLGVLG
jgi:hypothetical protein